MRIAIVLLLFCLLGAGCTPYSSYTPNSPLATKETFSCNPFPDSLPVLSEGQKESIMKSALSSLSDTKINRNTQPKSFPSALDGLHYEVVSTLWQEGNTLSFGEASSPNLAQSAYLATKDALSKLSSLSFDKPILPMITIISNTRKSYPQTNLSWGLQTLEGSSSMRSAKLLGTEFIANNYNRNQSLAILCSKLGKPADCINDREVSFFLHDELVIGVLPNLSLITFYRGNSLQCPAIHPINEAKKLHDEGKSWLIGSIQEDGLWPYIINPSTQFINQNGRNKDLREAMPARLLAEFAKNDPDLLPLHQKNINGFLDTFYQENSGNGFIVHENESKLNSNALMLRALVASPLYEEYSDTAQKLAETILKQQNQNGSFRNWYPVPGEYYNEAYLTYNYLYQESYFVTFSSGEAILALTELYLKTSNERYLNAAIKSQNYYLIEYVENMDINYYPAYVPWHTLSLYNLYLITGNQSYAVAIFTLNNKLLEIQNTNNSPYDFKGRFYNPHTPYYGAPHSSSDGVFTEGIVYAYKLALALNHTEQSNLYRERIMLSIHNMARLQFDDANTFYVSNPPLVKGAMRTSITNNLVRVDNTQHMLDGTSAFLNFEEQTNKTYLEDTLGKPHLVLLS